jgi:predicted DsbA family dithiol-disulfide isomerase
MALESPHIKADVIEVGEFPRLAQRYQVRGVPTTVINEQTLVVGAMDEGALLEQVMKVAEGAGLPPPSGQAGPTTPAPEVAQPQQGPSGGGRLILP